MKTKKFSYQVNKMFNQKSIVDFFGYFSFGKDKLSKLICNYKVEINNNIVKTKDNVIYENDIITIESDIDELIPYDLKINILYEDKYIIAVNKPKNILIHSDGNNYQTLLNAVYSYLLKKDKTPYVYPIHRIDYETTGIVIFAKDPLTLSFLCMEIEKHKVIKEYVCLCENSFDELEGTINKKISGNRHNSKKQVVTKTGKEATTQYQVLQNGKRSLVKVKIAHGRKHQIRVHMSSIKHPIIGDALYGNYDKDGLKLHFKSVTFYHPFLYKKMNIFCKEDFK